jgi:NADPH:quinone reductase
MHAVWYDRQGPAGEVLQVGELPDLLPGPGGSVSGSGTPG